MERKAVRLLSKRGSWQTRQSFVLFLSLFGTTFQAITIAFTGFQPKFVCLDGGNFTTLTNATGVFNDECEVINTRTNSSSACTGGFRYDVNRHETIVSEWDLVCDKAYLSEVSQLLFTVGAGVGSALITPVSDRLGRKWSFLVLRFAFVLVSFSLAMSPNIIGFMILRFMAGALETAIGLVRFVYIVELSPAKLRPFVTFMVGMLWAAALCLESGIGQLMRGMNWRYFQAVISIPSLTVVLECIFLKESLLWLYANGKQKQGAKLLETAMRTNGIIEESLMASEAETLNYDANLSTAEGKRENAEQTEIHIVSEGKASDAKDVSRAKMKTTPQKLNIVDLLRHRTTRKVVPIVCFTWFVTCLVYYGILLMSYAMVGDRILNFFLSAVVELPSYVMVYFCLKYTERKKSMVALHGLCAVSLLLAGIMNFTLSGETKVTAMHIVTFIGKFGISATFALIYIYTAEVFPTNFRSTALGLGSFSARIGSFLSPFASILVRKLPWGPGVIFGGLCLVVTCILILAPETRHRALPQSIEEIEAWKNDKKTGTIDHQAMSSK